MNISHDGMNLAKIKRLESESKPEKKKVVKKSKKNKNGKANTKGR